VGASDWRYRVPYEPDLSVALRRLHEQVLNDHAFSWPVDPASDDWEPAWPETLEELYDEENYIDSGTHSILDIRTIVASDEADSFGTLRLLRSDEAASLFGSSAPDANQVERAFADSLPVSESWPRRWSAHAVALHDNGTASEIVIWGTSGD
jgi:hypothetical protein